MSYRNHENYELEKHRIENKLDRYIHLLNNFSKDRIKANENYLQGIYEDLEQKKDYLHNICLKPEISKSFFQSSFEKIGKIESKLDELLG